MKISTIIDHNDGGRMAMPEFQRGVETIYSAKKGYMQRPLEVEASAALAPFGIDPKTFFSERSQ